MSELNGVINITKFQAIVDNFLKAVDNPATMRATKDGAGGTKWEPPPQVL
jgi:hypothetical protein